MHRSDATGDLLRVANATAMIGMAEVQCNDLVTRMLLSDIVHSASGEYGKMNPIRFYGDKAAQRIAQDRIAFATFEPLIG